jgi:hypothetical protein
MTRVLRCRMTRSPLLAAALLILASCGLQAGDVTGRWTGELAALNGGPTRVITIVLKSDGGKLTGTFAGASGRSSSLEPIEISDGKVDGDRISFTVKRETPNGAMENHYAGIVTGDEMKLRFTMMDQERDLIAKRVAN